MAETKALHRSFAAGEISEELFARVDLVKHQTGLATCRNAWTLPHGPAQNRSGFGYILEAKKSESATRVIPFSFNTEQTYVLELGDQYIRFHTQGATLVEAGLTITAITQANPAVLTYTGADPSNGDWMFLGGIVGMTRLNGRYVKVAAVNAGANTFQLTDIHGGANINTTGYAAYVSGGTASRVYEIASPYLAVDIFDIHFVQSNDVLTLVHPNYAPRELRRLSAVSWQLSVIGFLPTIATPAAPTVAEVPVGSTNTFVKTYVITAISSDSLEESFASPSASDDTDLTVAGQSINIVPAAAIPGATRYNVYKFSNGLYGYIGQTNDLSGGFTDDNITPDMSRTPPEPSDPFNAANEYPGAVGYHEQRRCFGGSNNKPQNFWATQSASESNLSYSIPQRDSDAIAFRIAAREVNRIRHIVSLESLFLLTSGAEFRVVTLNSDVLTPTTAAPKPIANEGASNVQPIIAGNSIIYVPESDSRFREMKYSFGQDGSTAGVSVADISVMAPHMFEGYTIDDLAYTKAPYRMAWGPRSDGKLIGVTYMPEHQVVAHHIHDTAANYMDGDELVTVASSFESVAAVREGTEFPLYVVVKRFINGRDVRYIERLHTRFISSNTSPTDGFFVDSGVTYSGVAADEISGLWHLEGCRLSILGDGAEVAGLVVEDGAVTLPNEVSTAHLGLQITSQVKTLPVALEASGNGQGITKNVSQVHMRMKQSSGFKIGPSFEDADLVEWTTRTDEDYGSPPELFSGPLPVVVMPEWGEDAAVCVQQTAPLPFTITGMTLDVALGA